LYIVAHTPARPLLPINGEQRGYNWCAGKTRQIYLPNFPEKNPGILFIYSFEKYPKSVLGKSIQKRTFTCQGSLAIFLQKGKIFHLKREASSREVPWSSPPFSDGRFSRIS
jgi:hypothetical protein